MTPLSRVVKRSVSNLVVVLYPNGVIGVRERGRRLEMLMPVAALYSMLVKAQVAAALATRSRTRRAR